MTGARRFLSFVSYFVSFMLERLKSIANVKSQKYNKRVRRDIGVRGIAILDEVNKKLTEKVLNWLTLESNSEQRIRIGYSIQVLLTEMEKLLFVLLFFVGFRLFWEAFFILATIMSLRPFVGGMHRKTTLGCILQTFLTISTIIFLSKNFWLYGEMHFFIIFAGIVVIWRIAPLPSENRIPYTEIQKKNFQLKAMTALVLLVLLGECIHTSVANLLYWSVALQLLEVILESYMTRRREEGPDGNFKRKA